jgi:hypothetical protein
MDQLVNILSEIKVNVPHTNDITEGRCLADSAYTLDQLNHVLQIWCAPWRGVAYEHRPFASQVTTDQSRLHNSAGPIRVE